MPTRYHIPLLLTLTLLFPTLTPAQSPSRVEITADARLRVNNKPFFPVGIYSATEEDFPELAKAGFNLVHTYCWEGISGDEWGKKWLDAAHEHGLMALVGLYRPRVRKMEFDRCVERVERFRKHPALLVWHTMDEPGWEKEKDPGEKYMPAAYKMVKEHDPDHPVTAVVCQFADAARFEDSVDVLQADYYPVPPIPAGNFSGTGFRGIQIYVDAWRKASGGKKPFWFVAQAFDYSLLKEDKDIPPEWRRFPTRRELRTMTYTAIASGARGVLFWSLSRLRIARDVTDVTPADHWDRLKSVTLELKHLMPLLTAERPESIQTKDRVVAMVKSDGIDTYIILANYERQPTETVIDVPGVSDATAVGVFGEKSAKVENGKLAVSLEPIESRVYRVVTNPGKHEGVDPEN